MQTPQVRKPEHVVMRELDGESILLNLETERYFGLDEVGTRMWAELMAQPSVEGACRALEREYDVEPVVLRRDLESLIGQLVESGLLETAAVEESPR
jgi:hypothetical protein